MSQLNQNAPFTLASLVGILGGGAIVAVILALFVLLLLNIFV